MTIVPKYCAACATEKSPDLFYKRQGKPDGWCKPCTIAKVCARKSANRARARDAAGPKMCARGSCGSELPPDAYGNRIYCSEKCRQVSWSEANPQRFAEKRAAWVLAHADELKAYNAARYVANRSAYIDYQRRYLVANRAKVKARSKVAYERDKVRILAYMKARRDSGTEAAVVRARRAANPFPFRAKESRRRVQLNAAFTLPFTPEQISARMAYFGDNCWMCGGEAGTLDHVKPLSRGGGHVLANFRPACKSCNSRKRDKWFGVSELHRFMK